MPAKTAKRVDTKFKPSVVKSLASKGHSARQIAKSQGVSHTTISSYLAHLRQAKHAVAQFEDLAIPAWSQLELDAHTLARQTAESMLGDNLDSLTVNQKDNRFRTVSTIAAIARDKVRLLTGQSTSNVSLINQHYLHYSTTKPASTQGIDEQVKKLPRRMKGSPLSGHIEGGPGGNDDSA